MKIYIALLSLALSLLAKDIDPKSFASIKMLAQPHIKITKAYDHGVIYELSIEI